MEHAMLPPVRAALISNNEHQGISQVAVARARVDMAPNRPPALSGESAPLSGGRLDALSLSAQLKLAQSFSIFAETIGTILKMPRRENEALADYATRLSEAVQALKPAERAAVERLLNQIVRGVSLRLLAELLKDPSGPEAARLAGYIETASGAERDLATKAVVRSYRQNGSSELLASSNLRPVQKVTSTVASTQPPPSNVPTGPGITTSGQPASLSTAPTSAATPASGALQADGPPGAPPQRSAPSQPGRTTEAPAVSGRQDGTAAGQVAANGSPASSFAKAAETIVRLAFGQGSAQEAVREAPNGSRPALLSDGPVSHESRRAPSDKPARLYDGPALARRSHEALRQEMPMPVRTGQSGSGKGIAELAGWLAGVFAESDLPSLAQASGRPANLPNSALSPGSHPPGEAALAKDGNGSSTGAARAPAFDDVAQNARTAEMADVRRGGAANPSQPAGPLEQQFGSLPGLPLPLMREGIQWQQVAYPPAEQDPQREERKARPVSEIGDEEDEAPDQNQDFHGKHQEREDNGADDEGEAEATPDDEQGRPNDLYWRMAGWA
jgi:hypothetical protein